MLWYLLFRPSLCRSAHALVWALRIHCVPNTFSPWFQAADIFCCIIQQGFVYLDKQKYLDCLSCLLPKESKMSITSLFLHFCLNLGCLFQLCGAFGSPEVGKYRVLGHETSSTAMPGSTPSWPCVVTSPTEMETLLLIQDYVSVEDSSTYWNLNYRILCDFPWKRSLHFHRIKCIQIIPVAWDTHILT